jgi:hypothetical protein
VPVHIKYLWILLKKNLLGSERWLIPIIPAIQGEGLEGLRFNASLGAKLARPHLNY